MKVACFCGAEFETDSMSDVCPDCRTPILGTEPVPEKPDCFGFALGCHCYRCQQYYILEFSNSCTYGRGA